MFSCCFEVKVFDIDGYLDIIDIVPNFKADEALDFSLPPHNHFGQWNDDDAIFVPISGHTFEQSV